MEGVEQTVTGTEDSGALSDRVVNFNGVCSQGQQRFDVKKPFHGWITARLIPQRFARNQIQQLRANLGQNALDSLGFLADSWLRLVVSQPAQAAGVEVTFTRCP